jgi:hypothetical protein
VINIDPDTDVGAHGGPTGLRIQDILQSVREFDPDAKVSSSTEIDVRGGATKVCLVRWEAPEPASPGLPDQQSLERLVCSALAAVHPTRANAVQSWLSGRPDPPQPSSPKEHAWSYLAGWYAEHGCEFFYTNLWKEDAVAAALKDRLQQANAWQIVEAIAAQT